MSEARQHCRRRPRRCLGPYAGSAPTSSSFLLLSLSLP